MTAGRRLGPSEEVLLRLDQVMSLNFTTVARVRGSLAPAQLSDGLAALQRRHPLLRVALDVAATAFVPTDRPIPLRVVAGGDWRAEVEREVLERFDVANGPLGRLVWIPGDDEVGHILFTLHHTIGDGKSGAFAVRDLLRAVAGDELELLEDPGPVDARVRPVARGARGLFGALRFFAAQQVGDLVVGKPAGARRAVDAAPPDRTVVFCPVELQADEVAELVGRCRAHETTLHGLLLTAFAQAIIAESGASVAPVLLGSPVDLRKTLVPPIADEVGLFVSMLPYRTKLDVEAPPWDVARALRRDIDVQRARGAEDVTLRALPVAARLAGAGRVSVAEFGRRWEGALQSTAGLTNLGRLPIEPQIGGVLVETLHFAVCPSILGVTVSSATSLAGNLTWNHHFIAPFVSRERAERISADAVARVRAAR
ncbi:MAG: hypothetical protein H6700_03635 [Myxococcales bacterium]|nr:hypothetical protein [Myxococcales bacterium]MCB9530833.1 hypothetical protein [Myxococcales bacterium]